MNTQQQNQGETENSSLSNHQLSAEEPIGDRGERGKSPTREQRMSNRPDDADPDSADDAVPQEDEDADDDELDPDADGDDIDPEELEPDPSVQ